MTIQDKPALRALFEDGDSPNGDAFVSLIDSNANITVNAVDPTATDDTTAGHEVGDHWLNTVGQSDWVAIDVTAAAAVWIDLTASAGGGEANTGSNIGVAGVGLFKDKVGVDLRFKQLNAGSAKITIADDTDNNEVDVDLGSVAIADLSDVTGKSGSGTVAIFQGSPTLTTPTIADQSNANHSHQNAAGGGSLDTGALGSGTVASARIAAKNKTIAKIIYIEDPAASDSFPLGNVPDAATMVRVVAVTDVGTVDFNIEKRGQLTPDVAGTNIWTVDKQATAAGLNQTSFDSGAVSADDWMHFAASAVAGSPTKLWMTLEYTID